MRAKILSLEATIDLLAELYERQKQVISILMHLMNKEQKEKFAVWLYMERLFGRLMKENPALAQLLRQKMLLKLLGGR